MDIQPSNDQHPATDDQELAKVLAGVDDQALQLPVDDNAAVPTAPVGGLQFEESPIPGQDPAATADPAVTQPDIELSLPPEVTGVPDPAPVADPVVMPSAPAASTASSSELEDIKKDALEELRPLVTKLDLPADEKFDTMLLIIRSTDDQSLLGAAHEAAKAIPDEKKRAEALLDVIKEIDYFGNQHAA
jgi:hypothetical protein